MTSWNLGPASVPKRQYGPRTFDPTVVGLVVAGVIAAVALGIVAAIGTNEVLWAVAMLLALGLAFAWPEASRARLFVILGALVNAVAIGWAYVDAVAPQYAYEGLVANQVPLATIAGATLLAAVPALWLPIRLVRPSQVVLWVLYLFGYTPSVLMPVFLFPADRGAVIPFELLLLVGFLAVGAMQTLLPRRWRGLPGLSANWFDRLMLLMGLGSLAYLVAFFGLPTSIPDFSQAYAVRADLHSAEADIAGSGYLITWIGNVIFPLLLCIGLARRRWLWLVLGAAGELLLYSQGGAKAILFNILFTPALFVIIDRWRDRFGVVLVWGAVSVLLVTTLVAEFTGSLWPIALYAVRMVALPGQLAAYYLDFFTSHAPYELSRSILRSFVASPYAVDPPSLIGFVYFHTVVNANANLWADAMANFGLVGIVPFSIVLGLILWILDLVAAGRDLRIVGAPLGLAGLSLANGALLTSILTYGLGLIILLCAAMPRGPDGAETAVPSPLRRQVAATGPA
jgi:hypothetical protein